MALRGPPLPVVVVLPLVAEALPAVRRPQVVALVPTALVVVRLVVAPAVEQLAAVAAIPPMAQVRPATVAGPLVVPHVPFGPAVHDLTAAKAAAIDARWRASAPARLAVRVRPVPVGLPVVARAATREPTPESVPTASSAATPVVPRVIGRIAVAAMGIVRHARRATETDRLARRAMAIVRNGPDRMAIAPHAAGSMAGNGATVGRAAIASIGLAPAGAPIAAAPATVTVVIAVPPSR